MCMARQSAAAKKKARASARARRGRAKFSIINGLEALVIGNALTQGAFQMSLVPWAFEGWLTPATTASNNSWELSAAEIVQGLVPGGANANISSSHMGGSMTAVIMNNIKKGIVPMTMTLVFAPIAFGMVKRLARRPISMFNRVLGKTGVPIKV